MENIFLLCPPTNRIYSNRSTNGLKLLKPPLTHVKAKFITQSICDIWNRLPAKIVADYNSKTFRKNINKFITTNYITAMDPTQLL